MEDGDPCSIQEEDKAFTIVQTLANQIKKASNG